MAVFFSVTKIRANYWHVIWNIIMVDIVMKYAGIVVAFFFLLTPVQAKHNSDHPLSPEDWKDIMDRVVLLEDSGLMPMLLPIIMGNQDALQLTDEQIVHSAHGERRTTQTWLIS